MDLLELQGVEMEVFALVERKLQRRTMSKSGESEFQIELESASFDDQGEVILIL